MKNFDQAATNFEASLNSLGLTMGADRWISVDPLVEEDKSLNAHVAYRGQVFTSEAYEKLKQKLEDSGFVQHHRSTDSSYNSITWKKEGSPIKLYMKVELATAEECAKLKARLAELGCHY